MKTTVSFRTSIENKIKLMEKAEKLGISISDLLDTLLIDDLNNISKTKVPEDAKRLMKRSLDIVEARGVVGAAYRQCLKAKEKLKNIPINIPEFDELVNLLNSARKQLKENYYHNQDV